VPKRRLPVLQNANEGSDEPPRPAWQWVGFGALAIVAVWVPLSALAGAVAASLLAHMPDERALGRAAILTATAYLVELAAGAFAGGYLIGKWGPAGVGVRQAALAGLTAAAALGVGTWASFGPTIGMALVAFMAPLTAALGGKVGARRRVL